ncbi:MAG: hypothetical protein AB2565_08820 [Candidatus Thiodiazotropha endolucinida]|uniref:Uncharacterized protein n=1 Tax=Candidatus Thiodiazotropha endolucinida TaxID=1655433 RepID=A0A7Z1AGL4_9GAMM|nr:hypothetical protein [Candidatus Thiodiazotropha endolucinida]ODJ88224.1 hypothetical protein CODIS_16370 [Candidatus Thiodiazotropha endolucinida]
MKVDERKSSAQTRDEEFLPQGNPIILIFVLLLCLTILFMLTSAIANGAEKMLPNKAAGQTAVAKWKPPVAHKIIQPEMVSSDLANEIADKWGIRLISLRLTAAGYMIDFRFRVLNVEKSKNFFDQRVKPHLVVERSNAKLPIPMAAKVGAFRTTNRGQNIKPNRTYYMVFGNPDAHVKSGEKVTMVIGDFKAEHLIVH